MVRPGVGIMSRRLTALRPDARVPGNLVVEVDGARFASIPVHAASSLNLQSGAALDPADYQRLSHVAEVEAAYRVAARLLAARPRSVAGLRLKLLRRGHPRPAVRDVIDRLEERGLLDDASFARHFARVRSSKGHGPHRIRTDLLAHGVDGRVADAAIHEVLDREGIDVLAQARSLAAKRAGQIGRLPRDTKLRRMLGYLARRGFTGHEITEIVLDVLDAESD